MRLVIINAILALATAQEVSREPLKDFCRRHQQQTCVVDNRLYIDGGLAYYGTGISPSSRPETNTFLLYGDLAQIGSGAPPLNSSLPKGSDVPSVSGGALWPDTANKLFYLFGGEYSNSTVQSFTGLWFYDILNAKWDRAISDGSQARISWPAFGASAVTDEGIAYYYGGYLSNKSVSGWTGPPLMLNSLVKYDMNQKTWSNRTDGTPRADGTLQYIPAGDRGMLVYFGGVETLSGGYVGYQVQVFDIANSRWYTQTATGDVPRPRRGFCSGVVWAKDKSSYNIYIYGGISSDGTAVGDVYILSLPSFRWIPYYEAPGKRWFGGKAWASCSVINNSQMVIMSGFYTNVTKDACDQPTIGGQATLLLGQEGIERGAVFRKLESSIVEYRVPANITEVIGGDTNGKASVTAPAAGWATADLSDGFKRTYSAVSRVATRPVSSSTTRSSATSTSAPSSGSKTNVGAIAGGVVGGVVVLVAIFILAFCCLRSRRRKQVSQAHGSVAPAIDPYTRNPPTEDKSAAHLSMSQASTMYSPNPQTAMTSPAGSPRPQSDVSKYYQGSPLEHQQHDSRWNQPAGVGYSPQQGHQQAYYPPPQSGPNSPVMSVELPNNQTPAYPVELPNVSSPKPMRGLY
ncbi:hypothetical protein CC86DRAFT_443172 [Ophiobolus disseminans]|uniref:Attractin/MKLN-like beta-propeller domain-containing protein n=1 Tax=Ophiobolus disseminans TaxID=1469910 RepID=A0A6A7AFZ6_9PLEO|nr:hypothetical protein CC86DRAFT_443172 [Ophiobolus disseminans]